MRIRVGAVVVAALILAASFGLAAVSATDSSSFTASKRPKVDAIIGFRGPIDDSTIASLGGIASKRIERLGLVGVEAADPAGFVMAARGNPLITFAETNDRIVRAVGTGWDATGWDGTGWDGTGWDGTGWDGVGWDGTAWDGTGWDGTGWDGTSWDGTGWDGTGWDGTGWDGTGWDGTGWDGTSWDGTGWDGTGWDGTGWDGVNYSGTGWDGTGWDGTGWDGTGWDGTGWDGTSWDGTGWDGTSWDGSLWNQSFLASKALSANGDPLSKYQWGWHTVNAKQAIRMAGPLSDGKICVVDSGVDYRHPDIAASMWRDPATGAYGYDFVNNDSDPMDDAGHGTHVAGIAAAANRNGVGVASAGATKIVAVKVLGADGGGREMDLALGIDYCLSKGARVISMSLSTPEDSPAVRQMVQDAAARGAILVAAAGNTGKSGAVRYPAAYPDVIAVAATMPDGRWAPYSTAAPYVDLAAPGYAIVSTYRNGTYAAVNGTSMAAPFVSGTAALLLKVNATFTARDVKAIMGRSAIDLGPSGPDEYVGFGFLRADRAVKLAHSR